MEDPKLANGSCKLPFGFESSVLDIPPQSLLLVGFNVLDLGKFEIGLCLFDLDVAAVLIEMVWLGRGRRMSGRRAGFNKPLSPWAVIGVAYSGNSVVVVAWRAASPREPGSSAPLLSSS